MGFNIFSKQKTATDDGSNLRVYENILHLLPDENSPTPLVMLRKIPTFSGFQIYGKLEWYNPFGSIKDRIAASLIEDAEKKGVLAGKKIIEPTSGNTGIGLAAISNLKGYSIRNTVSVEIPEEKKSILRFLGSEVVEVADSLCPDPESKTGAIGLAKSTAENLPTKFYMPNQYENEANFLAHYKTTGPEIWKQTKGKITHFIAGLGTCGTICGVAKFLKEKNPKVKVIAVYPEEGHDIPGVRSLKQLKVTKLYKPELYDQMVEVTNKEAYQMCLRLNREESIIAGPSSGMALAGALKTASSEHGLGVIIFPDNIFKYASFLAKNIPNFSLEPKEAATQQPNQGLNITPKELKAMMDRKEDFILVDVREPHEYQICKISGSQLIPLGQLQSKVNELDKTKQIVLHCHHGMRSMSAAKKLLSIGFTKVKSLEGGIDAWADEIDTGMQKY